MKKLYHYPKSNIVIAKTERYNVIFKYHDRNTKLVDELITCEDFSLNLTIKSIRIINFVSATFGTNTKNCFINLHNNVCLYNNRILALHEVSRFYLIADNKIRIEKVNVRLELK